MSAIQSLRDKFDTGCYQSVINDATNPSIFGSISAADQLSVRVLLYRGYLTQKRFNLVIQEIKPSDPDVLIAIQLLAMYLASPENRQEIGLQCKAIAGQVSIASSNDHDLCVVLSTVFIMEGWLDDSLKLLAQCPKNLECVALTVQVYCIIFRNDLAQAQVDKSRGWANDAILAQIMESWVGIVRGEGRKAEESFYLFEELTASSLSSAKLLSSKAVCLIHSKRYHEAEPFLMEALNKDPNDVQTIANLLVLSFVSQKPESVTAQYFAQLQDLDPSHYLITSTRDKSNEFDALVQKYSN